MAWLGRFWGHPTCVGTVPTGVPVLGGKFFHHLLEMIQMSRGLKPPCHELIGWSRRDQPQSIQTKEHKEVQREGANSKVQAYYNPISTLSHIKPWGNADTAGGSTLKFPAATAARFVKALVMPLRVPPQYPPPRFWFGVQSALSDAGQKTTRLTNGKTVDHSSEHSKIHENPLLRVV